MVIQNQSSIWNLPQFWVKKNKLYVSEITTCPRNQLETFIVRTNSFMNSLQLL